jgi:hypothetical protein
MYKVELRVCLIRHATSETANHQMDHHRADHGFTGFRQQLVIFTQAAIAIEPAQGPFHNPALRDDHKALGGVGTLRDLQTDRPLRPQRPDPVYQRPSISPIRPDVPQPAKLVPEDVQESLSPVAVLHTGRRDDHRQHQPEGVNEDVPLAPLDLLARVIAPEPPFSVVLTD